MIFCFLETLKDGLYNALIGMFISGTAQVGGLIGASLGVNLVNALVVGLLGLPGFGLLMMLNWVLQ